MLNYLKVAFTNRWNLLAFIGGMAAAVLSGRPDVVAPIVLAAEVGYLGFLGTHPKFQKYVDAQLAKAARESQPNHNAEILARIRSSLPRHLHDRYDRLRFRCQELRQIARDLKHPGADTGSSLESLQLAGLDRLLWVYLRLLFTQHSLERFLNKTSLDRIENDKERVENRLETIGENQSAHSQKLRRTLEDNLKTSNSRIDNYRRAQANYEFVELEIDRLENKIKSLAELAVNRQEPDYISSQIDQVSDSMMDTEKTMNDLQFVTGLGHVDEETPELLEDPIQITE